MKSENEPIVTYYKKADKTTNRVILPTFFVNNNGRDFLMEVYRDKIVIKPVKKEEK